MMRPFHIDGAFKMREFIGMLSELDSRHPINFIKTAAPNKIMSKIYKL